MSAAGRKRHAPRAACLACTGTDDVTVHSCDRSLLLAEEQHVRHADDDYMTPAWCTRALLRRLSEQGILPPFPARAALDVLEPCAGAGAIVRVLGEELPAADVRSVELDPGRARSCTAVARRHGRNAPTVCADFLSLALENLWTGEWWPELVVTNPPYKLAREFVDAARQVVAPRRGHVAMLLRLGFLGSQARAGWLRADIPDVNVLAKRPSFTPDGRTDATEYAWFVWGPGRSGFVWVLEMDERDEHLQSSGRRESR